MLTKLKQRKNKNYLREKINYNIYTAFLFMGHAFWKENIEDRVKLLESIIIYIVVVTTASLCKKGLKIKE